MLQTWLIHPTTIATDTPPCWKKPTGWSVTRILSISYFFTIEIKYLHNNSFKETHYVTQVTFFETTPLINSFRRRLHHIGSIFVAMRHRAGQGRFHKQVRPASRALFLPHGELTHPATTLSQVSDVDRQGKANSTTPDHEAVEIAAFSLKKNFVSSSRLLLYSSVLTVHFLSFNGRSPVFFLRLIRD